MIKKKSKSFFFFFSFHFLIRDPDMKFDCQQNQNFWEQIKIKKQNRANKAAGIYQKILLFFYSFFKPKPDFLKNKWGYIISWWISEFLGRAGFEPAQTYCQRIYSPSPLTARASTQEESSLGLLIIHDQLPFVVPYPQGKSNPRCLLEREMSWTTRRWGPICPTAIILCS